MKQQIGTFQFPSGNKCTVYVESDSAGLWHVRPRWARPPFQEPEDCEHYRRVFLPLQLKRLETIKGLGRNPREPVCSRALASAEALGEVAV